MPVGARTGHERATAASAGSASTRRRRSARARGTRLWRRSTSPCRASIGVLAGEKVVYSLCRPPGHHAARSAFGGFCLLNNAAIAAQALIDGGAHRVTVLDVDAHHGNGTQQIFYQRGDVQFVSIHMDPDQQLPVVRRPCRRARRGRGAGANLNLPVPLGTTGDRYMTDLAMGDRCSRGIRS